MSHATRTRSAVEVDVCASLAGVDVARASGFLLVRHGGGCALQLLGQRSDGVLELTAGTQRVHVLPVGEIKIDPAKSDGVDFQPSGVGVSINGLTLSLVPAVADLSAFVTDAAAFTIGESLDVR